jgi:hypothetical protein
VLDRIGLPGGHGLRNEVIDRDAIFGMHHDQRAGLRGLLHCAQDLAIGCVEHAGIGHEHLEAFTPAPMQASISFSVVSLTSDTIMWNP